MNIVFAVFKCFSTPGVQQDMLEIADALLKRGDKITVFCHIWDKNLRAPAGMTVCQLPVSGFSSHARAESFIKKLKESMENTPHDCFIAFNRIPEADFYFAADNPFYQTAIRNVGKIGSWLLPRYRTFIAEERAVFSPEAKTVIFCLTNYQKAAYINSYHTPEERFRLLPPGIHASRKRPKEETVAILRKKKRRELNISDNETMLVQIASGFRTKGVDRSIVALAALPEEFRNKTRLFVAGRGKAKTFIKLAKRLGVDDRVTLLGVRRDIPDLLLAADLMIHPARNEAAGSVLIESLAAGTPVLCSGSCGFSHFVEESGGAVLPLPFSQRALNKSLLMLLSTPDKIENMKQNAIGYGSNADFYHRAEVAAKIIHGEI